MENLAEKQTTLQGEIEALKELGKQLSTRLEDILKTDTEKTSEARKLITELGKARNKAMRIFIDGELPEGL